LKKNGYAGVELAHPSADLHLPGLPITIGIREPYSLFLLIVRVIAFHEPLTSSRLVLLHILLCMGVHRLVHLDVAGYAQQTAVGWVIGELFHLLHALTTLHWYDMVHVHTRRVDALG
jgi:hypothetical protein